MGFLSGLLIFLSGAFSVVLLEVLRIDQFLEPIRQVLSGILGPLGSS